MSNLYGISSVPTMFLVEPDGMISRVIEGWNRKDMEALAADARYDLVPPRGQRPGVEGGMKFAQLGSRREPR